MKTRIIKIFAIIACICFAQGCMTYIPAPVAAYPAYPAYPAYANSGYYSPAPAIGIGIMPSFGFRGGFHGRYR
jgi:hypothetical protein